MFGQRLKVLNSTRCLGRGFNSASKHCAMLGQRAMFGQRCRVLNIGRCLAVVHTCAHTHAHERHDTHAVCHMPSAKRRSQSATCRLPHAVCNLLQAICHTPSATVRPPLHEQPVVRRAPLVGTAGGTARATSGNSQCGTTDNRIET